ncbi:hypothetical protein ACRN9O_22140 [Shewanella oncorhynchi]|uniref:hypothetical protein n=1 Tax=Shewanella oncorhynchi TaxID=2726434 RepID=UPI003D7ABC1A
MSTKEWVYQDNELFGLYQEITFDKDNDNPAVIEITNPIDFKIIYESNAEGKLFGRLEAEIPADVFDQIAIAWCKKRELQGALGGPVGLELGGQTVIGIRPDLYFI